MPHRAAAPAAEGGADPHPDWRRSAVIYQIYPRSFADSDGDGVGDLPGVTSRLPYLRDLGVDAVWISPFYPSPQADAGYDVADYCDVDPLFGDLAAADELISRAHELGLRVIVDVVPNHTSDEHPWFQRALAAPPGSAERDWYVFRDADPEDPERPPNNWPSEFGGSAWSRAPRAAQTEAARAGIARTAADEAETAPAAEEAETAQAATPRAETPQAAVEDAPDAQWYLHLFDSKQPDLNWRNPAVREAFLDILRFWLDRGVDGFRVDVAHGLIKAEGLPDSPLSRGELQAEDVPTCTAPYWDQDGVHEIYRSWRELIESYPGERAMAAEAWVTPLDRLARYVRPDEFHQAFNFAFLGSPWRAETLRERIAESFETAGSVGAPTTWVLSNHDVIRHATRLGLPPEQMETQLGSGDLDPNPVAGLRRARAATALMLALPGSAYLYQGEELGLPEVLDLPAEARQDPTFHRTGGARLGRDGCRVPLPWRKDAPAYGFSDPGEAWLPQPPVFAGLAADQQLGERGSTLELYRALLAARRERGLGGGSPSFRDLGDEIVAMDVASDAGVTRVVLNLGDEAWPIPDDAEVLVASGPLPERSVPADCAVWLAVSP